MIGLSAADTSAVARVCFFCEVQQAAGRQGEVNFDSDDEEEVNDKGYVGDEEVHVVDRKSLVDMLLDCWKRKGVKEADLVEIRREARL